LILISWNNFIKRRRKLAQQFSFFFLNLSSFGQTHYEKWGKLKF